MKRIFLRGVVTLAFASAIPGSYSAQAADPAEEKAVLKAAQDKLKSVKTNDRVEALKRLRDIPTPEAVKLVFERGLRDKQPEVRGAGLDMLFANKNNPAVCEHLVAFVKQETSRKQPSPDVSAALAVLFSSELPEPQAEAKTRLETQLKSGEGTQRFLDDLMSMWTRNSDKAALPQLVRLARTDLVARNFAFHRALVQSLIRFQDAAAIEPLIDLLAEAKGEVRLDIVRQLRGLTGQMHSVDAAAWRDWWEKNKVAFRPPARYVLPSIDSLADGQATSYYGLPLYAQRIVFVLDTSGSMSGLRLEAAKAELMRALEGLPGTVGFSVVVFNSRLDVWQKQLVPATPDAKRSAQQYVASQGAQAQTATYDALEAAFLFDAEAIYFLSDGVPTTGKIVRPADIVGAVTRGNRGRLISLYTIGIGDELRGPSGAFMQQMAEQNFGVYRSVR